MRNGLVSVEIGSGSIVSGNFSTIKWGAGPYFIKTETDITGGLNYDIIGTSELLSVPYALFAGNGSLGSSDSWTVNGDDIYSNTSGNVGIGTLNPTSKLTLKTPINSIGWTHIGGSDSVIVIEGIGGVSAALGTLTNHAFRLMAGGQGLLQIYPGGEVVVGGNNIPSYGKFTVATLNNSFGISQTGEGGNVLATRIGGTSAGIGTFSNTNMRIFANGVSAIFIASGTSNVGIGKEFPDYKLEVNGTIRCKEVIVETINWPDYVFTNTYKLTPLKDLETYIQLHHHLPNITCSTELEKSGLQLGVTQKQMMEKIEELTLYLIEANKKITALEQLVYQKQ